MDFPDLPIGALGPDIFFEMEDVAIELPNKEVVTNWLLAAAEGEGKTVAELTYIFCSDEYLLTLNREHLQHDYFTDVITFPYSKSSVHGDVFISTDRVADNARNLAVPFFAELCRVMVHGLLHLAGYDDQTPEARATMTERENFHLRDLPLQQLLNP